MGLPNRMRPPKSVLVICSSALSMFIYEPRVGQSCGCAWRGGASGSARTEPAKLLAQNRRPEVVYNQSFGARQVNSSIATDISIQAINFQRTLERRCWLHFGTFCWSGTKELEGDQFSARCQTESPSGSEPKNVSLAYYYWLIGFATAMEAVD